MKSASLGNARCLKETDKAVLVEIDDHGDAEFWVPKSQLHDDSEVYGEDHEGELVVSEWWAEKEGLA